jgi:threonine dehydratase
MDNRITDDVIGADEHRRCARSALRCLLSLSYQRAFATFRRVSPASMPLPLRPVAMIAPPELSDRLGTKVVLASEVGQFTGSFKFRAASNVAANVSQKHIVTASSGNYGQALAAACQRFGKTCNVVMPTTSVRVKIEAVRSFGAAVEFVDTQVKSRQARIAELAAENPHAYVSSAYDDPLVIAGNASLGRELAAMSEKFDCVLAPIGGGGLTAGIITGLRECGCGKPVWAAEPLIANDAARSLREGRIVAHATEPMTIADGVRTLSVGKHNWGILRDGLAGVIEVTEDRIIGAVRLLFDVLGLKVEPTGALSIAALLERPQPLREQTVCCVLSGGNVDPERFEEMLRRGSQPC